MMKTTVSPPVFPLPQLTDSPQSLLTQFLRRGVEQILAQAIEHEVEDFLQQRQHLRDERGRQLVVRNGHLPARTIHTDST